MKTVLLDSLNSRSAAPLADMLSDPTLRASLFGVRVDAAEAGRIWSQAMDDEERWIVRCMESRRIVGGIGVIREQVSFFVHPHLQGQGYGRAALAALQRLRQARGAWPRLSAWTIRENSAARRAFEAANWLELGTRRQHRGQPTLVHYRSPLI